MERERTERPEPMVTEPKPTICQQRNQELREGSPGKWAINGLRGRRGPKPRHSSTIEPEQRPKYGPIWRDWVIVGLLMVIAALLFAIFNLSK